MFCWLCGRKLWGNHHVKKVIDEHERTLHKSCSEGSGGRPDYEILEEEWKCFNCGEEISPPPPGPPPCPPYSCFKVECRNKRATQLRRITGVA